jgi:hypothetical protein
MTMDAQSQLDHLVVLAHTLAEGVDWCKAALGVTPGPGGEHPLFGTHNRLLAIGTAGFPLAYLELIAVNPQAGPLARKRWFDMDDERLREQVRAHGPRLIHWVARVPDAHGAAAVLAARGIDRGQVLRASRMTPGGLLQWQITVRPDGQRLCGGCLPTLIAWGAAHPAAAMPASGLALQTLTLRHPRAAELAAALAALGLAGVPVRPDRHAAIDAALHTPRGAVTVSSAMEPA